MECTQKLECTQDLYETYTERVCPEQIGFLGICGAKHPILQGPNKIGRDPQTCSIVLNLNSVSRQHAVINILSSKEFMLMDLDSANKTKLMNKTLQPYIPHPLKNGDTVQFGDTFGIFRLLEEDDELPMTQAIDIPETPIPSRHVSKLNKAPTTMIPESPDVSSDRDQSFITPSQLINDRPRLKNEQFIKPFGKSIPIHPISSPKDTSPKSSKNSISCKETVINNIREQALNSIDDGSTNVSTDSIYMADTQIPPGHGPLPSIYSLDTQIPAENLPQVQKIDEQKEMQFDIYAVNKENERRVFNADTQPFICQNDGKTINENIGKKPEINLKPKDINKSEEEILFDDIEDECLEDFNSQPLLPQESPKHVIQSTESSTRDNNFFKSGNSIDDVLPTQKVEKLSVEEKPIKIVKKVESIVAKTTDIIQSDNSTDCEDIEIMASQKIPEGAITNDLLKERGKADSKPTQRLIRIQSDSSTDCEDVDMMPTQKILELKEEEDITDCEDDFIEISSKSPRKPLKDIELEEFKFEDMATQIIEINPDKIDKPALEDANTQIDSIDDKSCEDIRFEDQPTQIVEEINPNNSIAAKTPIIVSPFKMPLVSPIRIKNKEIPNIAAKDKPEIKNMHLETYYNATQDILDDLSTQRDELLNGTPGKSKAVKSPIIVDDAMVPCSVENYVVGAKSANIDHDLSQEKCHDSQKIKQYVASLSSQDVRDVIGIDRITKPKKYPSDSSSDLECTPKKVRACMFTDSDLPNSQEIETSRLVHRTKLQATEISSESEAEENSEEQHTPLLHRKKKVKAIAKLDLTKKFDAEKLPERIITRVRKPTAKMQQGLPRDKKVISNILKPTFLTEEDEINEDIINENVKRLKTYERAKGTKEIKGDIENEKDNHEKIEDSKMAVKENSKNDITVRTKTEKNKEDKSKIKVKIVKRKKKETDTKSITKEEVSSKKSTGEASAHENREDLPVTENIEIKQNKKDNKNKMKDDSLQSKSDGQISTRRTKSGRKEKDNNAEEKKPVSPGNNKKKSTDNKSKRSNRKRERSKEIEYPKETIEQSKELESSNVEIRRSKRKANAKDKKLDSEEIQVPKSILKKSDHEQSTVYNISTSGGESPKNLKRSLGDDVEVPSPKRTRAFVNNGNNGISNASLRATPARIMKTQHVLFTAFPCDEVKHKLEKLGAVVVTDVMKCSIVLTMQIKRTFKLLCAVGLGRPIVGPSWVQACADTHMIVDPWLYLIKDEQAEKRFQFNLDKTLNGKRNFLKGYNISSTPSVQPNGSEMKLIVECSGGTWKEAGPNWVCISCTKDQALWPALRKRGAIIVSTEFILGGVLKQKLDINANKFT